MMGVEEHKEIVRRFIEVGWGRADERVFDECLDRHCYRHISGSVSSGQSDAKLALRLVHLGLSDIQITIEQLFGENDLVVVRSLTRGTHTGEYVGVPPTGCRVEISAVDLYRFANGRIVESWHNVDELGLLRQLGLVPMRAVGKKAEVHATC
jgi:predicted ester cyclase